MPRKSLPRSVRVSAATSVIACAAGLAGEDTHAETIWTPGPTELNGTYETVAGNGRPFQAWGDFDQDGLDDFFLYYYFGFRLKASGRNSTAKTIFDDASPSQVKDHWWIITPAYASSLEEVFSNALSFEPLPEGDGVGTRSIDGVFTERGFWSATFEGGDGNLYVGYVELKVVPDSSDSFFPNGDGVLTIYDSGYALIPEPSSLALLGLGGLLIARRRRG